MHIILLAFLTEAIWETLKMVFEEDKIQRDRLGAIIVSVVFAIAYSVDIFSYAGLSTSIPLVGTLGTGIIVSRGANFIHDLLEIIAEKA